MLKTRHARADDVEYERGQDFPAPGRVLDHGTRHIMTIEFNATDGHRPQWIAPPVASRPFVTPPPPPPPVPPSAPLLAQAPSAPAVVAPTPVEATIPTNATEALDELIEVIAGARGAVLASVDGFALAQSKTMPNEAAHAAMLAAAMGLAHQLVIMGGGRQLRQLVVDHDAGLLLLWPIGETRVLSMLTDSTVDQTRLRRFVRSRAALLADGR